MLSVTGSILALELSVVVGDLNGHVDTMKMGMMELTVDMALEREMRMTIATIRVLWSNGAIVTNTCFKRQKNKLATYVSGSIVGTNIVSTNDLLLRRCDR